MRRWTEITELVLGEPSWYPLGEGPNDQPSNLALSCLTGLREGEEAAIQIIARPVVSRSRWKLLRAARQVKRGKHPSSVWRPPAASTGHKVPVDPWVERDVRAILDKAASPLFESVVRLAVVSPNREVARGRMHALAGAFSLFTGRNRFHRRRIGSSASRLRSRSLSKTYLLSVPELAQLATLPAAGSLPGIERAGARPMAPTKAVPSEGRVLGVSDHPASSRDVAIGVEDARHHIHILGPTGVGKSTLLCSMVLQDAEAGRAALVIDPAGDLVEAILKRLPAGAEERTCVLDPDDGQMAVGLDVLRGEDHDVVVEHVLGVFRRIYEPWWGPRTDDIMRAACLTLKHIPGTTLCEIPLLLTSYEWRREVTARMAGVIGLNDFWAWYEKLPDSMRNQHIAPLLNKLRAFLLRGPIRAIVGQANPKRNIEDLIDSGGLLLVRIPKGTLGEETSRLLGAFVIARIWQACMKRASIPESQRKDITLYVDEAHNQVALPHSFEDVLAEIRKWGGSVVLPFQQLGQASREMRQALDANARTKIVFVCSPEDAGYMDKHFEPDLTAYDLSHLARYQAACRPCIGGAHLPPFTFRTKALEPGSDRRALEVRRRSNEQFGTPTKDVEEAIRYRHRNSTKLLLPNKEL